MTDIDLHALSTALPLCAEEGPYREVVAQSELVAILACTCSDEKAQGAMSILLRIFEAFGLLDTVELARGNWAFASFPAYLMGRSLLDALATPDLTLFHPGYWRQEGHQADSQIEEQRRLLAALEGRRVEFHPSAQAMPIRFVFVAWGLIRLGDDFLLVHREDKSRPDSRNYVFPGGRFHIDDLPATERNAEVLRRLHSADTKLLSESLERTLSRELNEELNLRISADYQATPRVNLKPYRKIEGARNNHAFTEYHIRLFSVSLTPEGEARLLDHVAENQNLVWFRLDDLLSPTGRADGKAAFIDALRQEHGDRLREFLSSVPNSSGTDYRITGETSAVDLSAEGGQPFRIGKTGKEKELLISLNPQEHSLLSLLLAHARGFDVLPMTEHLRCLGGGWVKLLSSEAQHVCQALAHKLADSRLPLVQMTAGQFARVAIDPATTYFSESAFRYQLDGYRLQVTLSINLLPWAALFEANSHIELDPTLTLVLRHIQTHGSLWKGENFIEGKDADREFREKLDKHLRVIGLRKLIRTSDESYMISVPVELE